MSVDTPLKWLLKELPAYIPREHHALLMERFEMNKRAYANQVAINRAERTIKTIQYRNNPHDAAKLARWHAKLAKLKEESR